MDRIKDILVQLVVTITIVIITAMHLNNYSKSGTMLNKYSIYII